MIAKKIGGNVEETESELLRKILGLQQEKHEGSLSDLISGMSVDKEKRTKPKERRSDEDKPQTRADYVRKSLGKDQGTDMKNKPQRPKRTE